MLLTRTFLWYICSLSGEYIIYHASDFKLLLHIWLGRLRITFLAYLKLLCGINIHLFSSQPGLPRICFSCPSSWDRGRRRVLYCHILWRGLLHSTWNWIFTGFLLFSWGPRLRLLSISLNWSGSGLCLAEA